MEDICNDNSARVFNKSRGTMKKFKCQSIKCVNFNINTFIMCRVASLGGQCVFIWNIEIHWPLVSGISGHEPSLADGECLRK